MPIGCSPEDGDDVTFANFGRREARFVYTRCVYLFRLAASAAAYGCGAVLRFLSLAEDKQVRVFVVQVD
jgi:hypothetical protein